MTEPVLAVDDLTVTTRGGGRVLDAVSLRLGTAESLGVVGESGSGKTTLAHAILGFARPGLRLSEGSVRVQGRELLGLKETELRALRGRLVSYVPQDPATALNPSMRIGAQLAEVAVTHAPGRDSAALAGDVLERVGLPSDDAFRRRYPHELSGGQQQRVAIGMALCCDPPLVVLDEPTTGLDVVTQARILSEVRRLQQELQVALVYVSHDLAAVAAVADRVLVMYAGDAVEYGSTADVISRPRHPYTQGLVSSVPDHRTATRPVGIPGTATGVEHRAPGCRFAARCTYRTDACVAAPPPMEPVTAQHEVRCLHWRQTPPPVAKPRIRVPAQATAEPLLVLEEVSAGHRRHGTMTTVVREVSFTLDAGECLALVGESGSGKTTTARCIAGLHPPAGGTIRYAGSKLAGVARRRTREQRRRVQIVFQNPYGSLNPRQTVAEAVSWPARTLGGAGSRTEAEDRVRNLLDRVRLPSAVMRRYPGELSGGERQRVAIARALAAGPQLLICDEVTSALDVSVQAATLELLGELQRDLDLALLFITHDLGVVASVADRVLVLEGGALCEQGDVDAVLAHPQEPYTRRLIAAAPSLTVDVGPQRAEVNG